MEDQLKLPIKNSEEKAKRFLNDVMGQEQYNKFIKEGKIEIKSGDNIYILSTDGGVINNTTEQKYCIVPKVAGLPIYDILAVKYAWLKHGHNIVEEVARKNNIQIIHTDNGRIIRDRLTYDDFINYMEDSGWRRKHMTINEDSPIIGSYNNGIKIDCPSQQILTMKGYEQDVNRIGYRLWLKVYNKDDKELNHEEIIQIIKLSSNIGNIGNYSVLWRGPYNQLSISVTQNISITIGSPAGRTISLAGTPQYYTWRQGIIINGGDSLIVKPLDNNIKIEIDKMEFYMEADLWTKTII